jgi:E3 ubiquitin-protein ligase RFWD2
VRYITGLIAWFRAQSYKGHKNEKNFVGLTTNGEYIACGSENNSVYCYHKNLTKPLIEYPFGTICASTVCRDNVSGICSHE